MITVNLLPVELRPVERTPLPRLLVVLMGVALGGVGLVFLIFLHLILVPRVHNAIEETTNEVSNLRVLAAEYDVLARELQSITQRETAVKDILRSGTVWWKKLDLLCDLVPSYAGLTTLSFRQTRGARPGVAQPEAGALKMDCLAAEAEEKRVAAVRRILKGELPPEWGKEPDKEVGKQFIVDFIDGEILDSGWRVETSSDFPDQLVTKFALEMKLKSKAPPPAQRPVGTQAAVPAGAAR